MALPRKGLLLGCTAWLFIWGAATCPAVPNNPAADWLKDARFGVFMHFLPGDDNALAQVARFDVEAIARQLHEAGAGYFIITLGQNSGYYISPNATYDKICGYRAGQRCSTRDLPLDLYPALKRKGIRLILYLPCQTPFQDHHAQKAFGLPQGSKDQPLDMNFAKKWATVIQEWSDRYGKKVLGWWFDGAYQPIRFDEAIGQIYADAVRHGNSKAIVAFNPGVARGNQLKYYSHVDDYTAGELDDPFNVLPVSRRVDGLQWHALTYLGSSWAQRDTRFPTKRWVKWVKAVVGRGGVVTLDLGPNWDPKNGPIGALDKTQLKQVKAVKAAL
jgi:hypothetical protein